MIVGCYWCTKIYTRSSIVAYESVHNCNYISKEKEGDSLSRTHTLSPQVHFCTKLHKATQPTLQRAGGGGGHNVKRRPYPWPGLHLSVATTSQATLHHHSLPLPLPLLDHPSAYTITAAVY